MFFEFPQNDRHSKYRRQILTLVLKNLKKKDRVKEQTGLNVSTLYIAQVKKKCGFDVGENYNKPKADNAKSLQCPPEKEAAIQDALKWFGML